MQALTAICISRTLRPIWSLSGRFNTCNKSKIEVCWNVCMEPHDHLKPIISEQLMNCMASTEDCILLDVSANSFWGSRFDANSLMQGLSTPRCLQTWTHRWPTSTGRHRCEKCNNNKQWTRSGGFCAAFISLKWSASGDMAPTTEVFLMRLASTLAEKRDKP